MRSLGLKQLTFNKTFSAFHFGFLPFRIYSKAFYKLDQNVWPLGTIFLFLTPSFFTYRDPNHTDALAIHFGICSQNFIVQFLEFQHKRALNSPKLHLQTLFPLAQPPLFRMSLTSLDKITELERKVHHLMP